MSSFNNEPSAIIVPVDNPIVASASIEVHNIPLTATDIKLFEDENLKFGIMRIQTAKTQQSSRPVHLEIDVDRSGSMRDFVVNLRTKLDFVKKTLDSMCEFISEQPDAHISISVNQFDDSYENVIPATRVTLENRKELIAKINTIQTRGSTNIEETLLKSSEAIEKYREQNPTHKIVYILLTDGLPNIGNTSTKALEKLKPNASNKCIGYGEDHNAELLQKLGDYYFVNDFENTGKVYGEILHKVLYPALESIEFTAKNGRIYNAATNTWDASIQETEMYSEQERIYHVQYNATDENNMEVMVSAKIVGKIGEETLVDEVQPIYEIYQLPDLADVETGEVKPIDLRKYMYRQRTQELMFESIENTRNDIAPPAYKEKLQAFFRNMREYMRANDLLEDPFMKLLCDDILVTFKTFGTEKAEMYTVSRHTSQTTQSACRAVSNQLAMEEDNDWNNGGPRQNAMDFTLQRQPAVMYSRANGGCRRIVRPEEDNIDDEDDLNRFTSQQQDENLFATGTIMQTMRAVSER
jgi:hypothetical protein